MDEIVSLINSVGFPIAACVAMYIQMTKQNQIIEKNTHAIEELRELFLREGKGGETDDLK